MFYGKHSASNNFIAIFAIINLMNTIFIQFRDPLFGIILFFVIIFVVALFSYWWGRFKAKEDYRHLDKFLRKFRSPPSSLELKKLVSSSAVSIDSWLLLANSYSKNGEYDKSIEIYHELLSKKENMTNKKEIMFLLGQTYFKAGFLQRSKSVFLEILKSNPRTPQALRYLLLVYEYLKEYSLALEVLEPLETLGYDTTKDKAYLNCLLTLGDFSLSPEEKANRLIDFYRQNQGVTYLTFNYLFKYFPKLAWKNLNFSQVERLGDLYWGLDENMVDFDIIESNKYLRELFSAKGYIALEQNSSIFEYDVLINLHKSSYTKAKINFEYMCSHCKHIFPFSFNRCSNCHTIDSVVPQPLLIKEQHETFDSFL